MAVASCVSSAELRAFLASGRLSVIVVIRSEVALNTRSVIGRPLALWLLEVRSGYRRPTSGRLPWLALLRRARNLRFFVFLLTTDSWDTCADSGS